MSRSEKITLEILIKDKGVSKVTQKVKKTNEAIKETKRVSGIAAAEIDKLEKGAAGFAKNSTSAFAKQAQGMGGLVHVYATVAANVFALSAAYLVLKRNADLKIMEEAAQDLARTSGIAYSQIARDMQNITGGALEFTQAMRQANLALSGGATVQQVKQITEVATKAANALGYSVPEAVGRMIQAVTKGEPELIDELGIILRVTRATEEYAAAHNKAATELSTFEKQQAIINQVIKQGNEKFKNVEIKTNPYEKLSASVTELTKNITFLVSGPLGSIAGMISNSSGLILAGIAAMVRYVAVKAIPEISKIGATWRDKAEKGTIAATLEVQNYNKELEKARSTLKRFKTQGKLGMEGIGALSEDLVKTDFMPDLSKRTGLYKRLNKIISGGSFGKQFIIELKKANIDKELKRILDAGANGGKLSRDYKKFYKAHKDEIEILYDNITKHAKEASTVINKMKTEVAVVEARQKAAYAQAKASFTTGLSNVLSAGVKDNVTLRAYRTALADIDAKYALVNSKQRTGTILSLKWEKNLKKTGIAVAQIGRSIGLLTRVIPHIAGAFFAFEIFKSVLTWVGLLDSRMAELRDKAEELSDAFKEAKENYSSIGKEIATAPDSLSEVVAKWEKINNVTNQYLNNIKESAETYNKLGRGGILDSFVTYMSGDRTDLAKNIAGGVQELLKSSNKGFADAIVTTDKLYNEDQIDTIKRIENAERRLAIARANGNEAAIKGASQSLAYNKKLLEQAKRSERVINLTSPADIEKVLEQPNGRELLNTLIQKAIGDSIDQTKEFALVSKEASDAVAAIDSQISKLRQKSESRRIFNADTLISFRDNLKTTQVAVKVFLDDIKSGGNKTTTEVEQLFNGLPQAFKDAFIGLDLSGISDPAQKAATILDAMTSSLARMDKYIDTVKNLKSVLSQISSSKAIAELGVKAGDLSSIKKVYEADTKAIQEKIKAAKAEIAIKESSKKIFGQDVKKIDEQLKAERLKLALLQRQLSARKDIIPVLEAELVLLKRQKDTNKAREDAFGSIEKIYKKINTLTTNQLGMEDLAAASARSQQQLLKQQAAVKQQNLDTARAELIVEARKKAEQGEFVNQAELRLKLANIENQKQLELLNTLEAQKKIAEQIRNAENSSIGSLGKGFANSFSNWFTDDFWNKLGPELNMLGRQMGQEIANPIKLAGQVFVSGVESSLGALVDSLINRDWEGKDDGVQREDYIREALKATLRQTLGDAIKKNMVQATTNWVSTLLGTQAVEEQQIAATYQNTLALQQNTAALASSVAGSSMSGIGDLFAFLGSDGAGTYSKVNSITTAAGGIGHFANGGVVDSAQLAVIGEGKSSEAVVPLPDNRSIPVKMEGGGQSVTVVQNFDFTNADPNSEARLRQFAAEIKRDTIKELTNSINRGGSMAKVVGRRK